MTASVLSATPVGPDYLDLLRRDLDDAVVVRFAVAYVSESGLRSIGQGRLAAALSQPGSFGVASLTCSCGFAPLMTLQALLTSGAASLRYFLDPQIATKNLSGLPNLSLMHSKGVYVVRRDGTGVAYVGSHNWTAPAVGPGSPRNAEVSIRVAVDHRAEYLDGKGGGIAAELNAHLLACYGLAACLPATKAYEATFSSWYRTACEPKQSPDVDEYAVILAVADPTAAIGVRTADAWAPIARGATSIYFQCHEEAEGLCVRNNLDRVLVMVWPDATALYDSMAPVLLYCKVTCTNAGLQSMYVGTNPEGMSNFQWVLLDAAQNGRAQGGSDPGARTLLPIRTGRQVEIFDLASAASGTNSSTVDGMSDPRYQHYLQVYAVTIPDWLDVSRERAPGAPAESKRVDRSDSFGKETVVEAVWKPQSLAFAKGRSARLPSAGKYMVGEDEGVSAGAVRRCLDTIFGLSEDDAPDARALPADGNTNAGDRRFLSDTSLHATYLDGGTLQDEAFYACIPEGGLAADLAPLRDDVETQRRHQGTEPRVQQLRSVPLGDLLKRNDVKDADLSAWNREVTRSTQRRPAPEPSIAAERWTRPERTRVHPHHPTLTAGPANGADSDDRRSWEHRVRAERQRISQLREPDTLAAVVGVVRAAISDRALSCRERLISDAYRDLTGTENAPKSCDLIDRLATQLVTLRPEDGELGIAAATDSLLSKPLFRPHERLKEEIRAYIQALSGPIR